MTFLNGSLSKDEEVKKEEGSEELETFVVVKYGIPPIDQFQSEYRSFVRGLPADFRDGYFAEDPKFFLKYYFFPDDEIQNNFIVDLRFRFITALIKYENNGCFYTAP